ncbi:protein phosphatase 1 regulatory subunit SDS22 [Agrilus planipennis]|uniref:Protein phosphatase 1 regulatory subunit SDS22 n=1 Tax=Agrilus planipennis TaxID=224129 RepID=A0A1W4X4Y7_AGRPL|nr:protein phosphatase 1 regulatory subunit SDS22 [Agrilus planipennis]
MPPEKGEACYEVSNIEEPSIPVDIPPMTEFVPFFVRDIPIRLPLNTGTNLDVYFEPLPPPEFYTRLNIPNENNLKDLLQRVTGLQNVESVTQLKLKVITHDICLQNLSLYTPNLTELDLSGSSVSSLRDLGCGLKNLKVLKVNYCGIYVLDGLFGLQTLREIHAGHNFIKDISPCSFLPEIELIDMRYNRIENISTLSFLTLCTNLKHIILEGNREIVSHNRAEYRSTVRNLLRTLETLDEVAFTDEDGVVLPSIKSKPGIKDDTSSISQPSSSRETSLPPIKDSKTPHVSPKNTFKATSSKSNPKSKSSSTHQKTTGLESDFPKVVQLPKPTTSKPTARSSTLKNRTKGDKEK